MEAAALPVEQLGATNPRLRGVVFSGGQAEAKHCDPSSPNPLLPSTNARACVIEPV